MIAFSGVRNSWLMLARNCDLCSRFRELAALLLDLAEEPRVLDRQHRLSCESLQEIEGIVGEFTRLLAPDHQRADHMITVDQRHDQARAIPGPNRKLPHWAWRFVHDVGDLMRSSVPRRQADRIGRANVLVLDRRNHLFAQAKGGA